MDAHGADHLVGGDGKRGDGDQRDRDVVDGIAIVVGKNALLVAEHLPPQCSGLASLPGFGRELDAIFGGQERRKWIEDHATASRSAGCRSLFAWPSRS